MNGRGSRCALLLVLVMAVVSGRAAAQSGISVSPRFGYDNIIMPERWGPLRFILSSDGPPVTGTLTVRYPQDGAQDASTTVRFSLTPGVPTPVDVGLCLRRYTPGIGVTIRSDSGRTLVNEWMDFNNPGGTRAFTFQPPVLAPEPLTLLAVGFDDLGDIGTIWSHSLFIPDEFTFDPTQAESGPIEERLRLSAVAADDLFAFWSAYDGVAAIVVRSSVIDELPERVRRALLAWQSGGGELVVVVDDASGSWRRWMPVGPEGDVVRLDQPRRTTAPDSFMSIPVRVERTRIGDADLATPAESLDARAISITETGAVGGWELDYELTGTTGLAARGPCGLGFVTIVGFDPARAMAVRSRTSASIAWAAVLERLLPASSRDGTVEYYYGRGSGASAEEAAAIVRIVNAGVRGEGISRGVLLAVLAVLIAFVLAIGPVDALVLHRLRLRHWSWLTALGWVAVASVLAVRIPAFTASGSVNIGRLGITDAVLDADGEPVASWTTAVTTIYAGRSGPVGPIDERAAAWWRGVSPLPISSWGGRRPAGALGTLFLAQRPVAGPGGAQESVFPAALTQRGWTARALLDTAPERPPVRARVTNDGVLRLELAATPGLEIVSAAVFVEGRRWLLPQVSSDAPIELSDATAARVTRAQTKPLTWTLETHGRRFDWEALASAPGVAARGRALAAHTNAGPIALVEVLYTGAVVPFEFRGADHIESFGAVRLAVPIHTAEPAP